MNKMEFSFDPKELEPARRAFQKSIDRNGLVETAMRAHLLLTVARRVQEGGRLYGKTIFRLIDWYHWEWKKTKRVV